MSAKRKKTQKAQKTRKRSKSRPSPKKKTPPSPQKRDGKPKGRAVKEPRRKERTGEIVEALPETPPEGDSQEEAGRRLYTVGLVVVLIVLVLSGWIFYLANRLNKTAQKELEVFEQES